MGTMTYEWKIDKYKVTAQKAGEELERIGKKYGELRPEDVVTESKSKKAVLHSCFIWDDKEAAARYRIHQGQDLIRNVVAVEVSGKPLEAPVRAFVSIRSTGYVPVSVVVQSEDFTSMMLSQALKELEAFETKCSALRPLAELFGHMDVAKQNIRNVLDSG